MEGQKVIARYDLNIVSEFELGTLQLEEVRLDQGCVLKYYHLIRGSSRVILIIQSVSCPAINSISELDS